MEEKKQDQENHRSLSDDDSQHSRVYDVVSGSHGMNMDDSRRSTLKRVTSQNDAGAINHLHKLSNELIEMIGLWLLTSKTSILQFRSCSRKVLSAVDRIFNLHYFAKWRLCFYRFKSLQNLVEISRSTRKSAVKELKILSSFVGAYDTSIEDHPDNVQVKILEYVSDQDYLRRTGKDVVMLTEALRNLDLCSSIVMVAANFEDYIEIPDIGRLSSSTTPYWTIDPLKPGSAESVFNYLHGWRGDILDSDSTRISEATTSLVSSILAAVVEAETASIKSFHFSLTEAGPEALWIPSNATSNFQNTLSRLQQLSFVLDYRETLLKPTLLTHWRCSLSRFFACMTGLESLSIHIMDHVTAYSTCLDHDQCIELNHTWLRILESSTMHLLKLKLHGIRLKSFGALTKVIENLGGSLQELELRHLEIPCYPEPGPVDFAELAVFCPNATKIAIYYMEVYDEGAPCATVGFYRHDEPKPSERVFEADRKYRVIVFNGQDDIRSTLAGKCFELAYIYTQH